MLAQSEGEVEDEDDLMPGTERESLARGMSSLKGREYAIRLALEKKQEQYIDLKGITVYVATWNVNGQSPGSICLSEWLSRMSEPPDIYAVGFQELDLSKEAFLFNDTPKEAEWRWAKIKERYQVKLQKNIYTNFLSSFGIAFFLLRRKKKVCQEKAV